MMKCSRCGKKFAPNRTSVWKRRTGHTKHVYCPDCAHAGQIPRDEYGGLALLSSIFSWSNHDIGAAYGVSAGTISNILRKWRQT
jgi:DNA-directed RNA polymerase subunit RPC12/RpoP